MSEEQEQMYSDVTDIKECLVGNVLKNNPGLVNLVHQLNDRIGKIENRISNLEQKKKKSFGTKLIAWLVKACSA